MNIVPWLILLPVLAGLAVFALRGAFLRQAIVILLGAVLAVLAVILLVQGPAEFTPEPFGELDWGLIIAGADFLLLLSFIYFGIRRRSSLVLGFSLMQLAVLGWLELIAKPHTEIRPIFFVDWLSIIMVLIISLVGSLICVYALRYMVEHEEHNKVSPSRQPTFFLLLIVFLGAMNGLVMANHLLWVYFFWEVTTLCSFLLIGHDGTEEALKNATRALWMNSLGGAAFAAAIALIQLRNGTFSLQAMIQGGPSSAMMLLPVSLLVLAAFTKAAQMPFQSWLLGAMVAPTPVSALLHSSTMVKAGVYLILRLAPSFDNTVLSTGVAIAGAFTFAATAALAIGQSNSKRVLAYSTVSNLGLIIACAGINTPQAMAAAIILTIFHAVAKALLFLCVGTVEHRIGSRDIEDMEGLLDRMPLTASIALAGILTMVLAPFGVLISKWAAVEAALSPLPVMVLVVMGSAFTVVFWLKWMGKILSRGPAGEERRMERLSLLVSVPLLTLLGGGIALSLMIGTVADRLSGPAVRLYYGTSGLVSDGWNISSERGSFPTVLVFIAAGLVLLVSLLTTRIKPGEVRPIYAGGEQLEVDHQAAFRSVADAPTTLVTSSYYFGSLFGEAKLNPWLNPVAGLLLIAVVGVAVL